MGQMRFAYIFLIAASFAELLTSVATLIPMVWYLIGLKLPWLMADTYLEKYTQYANFLDLIEKPDLILGYVWYFALAFFFFSMNKNLRFATPDTAYRGQFTPWYSLFVFYIPLFNFVKPAQLIAELSGFLGRFNNTGKPLYRRWQIYLLWAIFILSSLFGYAMNKAQTHAPTTEPSPETLKRLFLILGALLIFHMLITVMFMLVARKMKHGAHAAGKAD